jgi:GntR family negative regulator for fad regulon and positive regulator of fabA
MEWETPLKPAELAEQRIIKAILDSTFPINNTLPSERELSVRLGVTRPTLREALQRLSRDGWLEIRQGKPTRIRDYWNEGNLNVLSSISKFSDQIPENFVSNLLQIRLLLCPTYASMAAMNNPDEIINYLEQAPSASSEPEVFSEFDFHLHQKLTQNSGNPIFTLILNGFMELFLEKAVIYFQKVEARSHSNKFYQSLKEAFIGKQPELVFEITQNTMIESINYWKISQ